MVFVTETLPRDRFSPRTWVFFPCVPGIKSPVLHTNSSVILGMDNIPFRATFPQRRILTQRREYKKMVLEKME